MNGKDTILEHLSLMKAASPAGYAMALHVRYTTPRYLFQTYDQGWRDHYTQNGMVMQDPTVRWGFENTGTIRWSELVAQDLAGVLTQAASWGLNYGVTIALDKNQSRSIASFARSDREFTDAEIAEIGARLTQMHDETAELETLAPATRAALRQLSVFFTHP